jgi:hypothetical protein
MEVRMSIVTSKVRAAALATLAVALLAGCPHDPRYVQPAEALEVNAGDDSAAIATTQLSLPIRLETEDEAAERAELAAELGVQVPYVRIGDLHVSLEWAIRNLSESDGVARIFVNGGNEWFSYVPANFVIDPDDDEEPPPLMGNIPIVVEAGQTVTGVFREDQFYEASVDLELITRGGYNAFRALLEVNEDTTEIVDGSGAVVPVDVFAKMVRLDIAFTGNRHMVFEYAVRVRDRRRPSLLHDLLLDAPDGELTVFAPADFAPPPPEM